MTRRKGRKLLYSTYNRSTLVNRVRMVGTNRYLPIGAIGSTDEAADVSRDSLFKGKISSSASITGASSLTTTLWIGNGISNLMCPQIGSIWDVSSNRHESKSHVPKRRPFPWLAVDPQAALENFDKFATQREPESAARSALFHANLGLTIL